MAEQHPEVETSGTSASGAYGESPPGMPRWVKALGMAATILILVFVGLHLTGHAQVGHIPFAGATEHSLHQP